MLSSFTSSVCLKASRGPEDFKADCSSSQKNAPSSQTLHNLKYETAMSSTPDYANSPYILYPGESGYTLSRVPRAAQPNSSTPSFLPDELSPFVPHSCSSTLGDEYPALAYTRHQNPFAEPPKAQDGTAGSVSDGAQAGTVTVSEPTPTGTPSKERRWLKYGISILVFVLLVIIFALLCQWLLGWGFVLARRGQSEHRLISERAVLWKQILVDFVDRRHHCCGDCRAVHLDSGQGGFGIVGIENDEVLIAFHGLLRDCLNNRGDDLGSQERRRPTRSEMESERISRDDRRRCRKSKRLTRGVKTHRQRQKHQFFPRDFTQMIPLTS